MEPRYTIGEIGKIYLLIKEKIPSFHTVNIYHVQSELKKDIDKNIKYYLNIYSKTNFFGSLYAYNINILDEFNNIIFSEFEELPLFINSELKNVLNWRFRIGK